MGWSSLRMLMKSDSMGFSIIETIVQSGASLTIEYKTTLWGVIAFWHRGREGSCHRRHT
ncbi:MAG: ectoine synthase [Ascidiaceihabitans sp.]|nr:ectoine synthase [Ascidiaceihabitans sp.]